MKSLSIDDCDISVTFNLSVYFSGCALDQSLLSVVSDDWLLMSRWEFGTVL